MENYTGERDLPHYSIAYSDDQILGEMPYDSIQSHQYVLFHNGYGPSAKPHNDYGYMPREIPSVRSSNSSMFRLSSNNSIFSQHQWRTSVASTNTTCSNASGLSRDHHVSQAHQVLTSSLRPTPSVRVQKQPSKKQPRPAPSPAKENRQVLTCVSRTKRSRRSTHGPRYWCTSCKEGFREKYDWKRHEETYQERCENFQCDLCKKTYFLEKDFLFHHRESHRCQTCVENKHANVARHQRQTRTGWGCGFCSRFDSDWTERCNHIAWHFEKNGNTIATWSQTQVILSLLQQPLLAKEWFRLLESKQEANPSFGWSQKWAGRAEGYPDSDKPPMLQDLLEFYTPDQNAAALVELAYEMGHQQKAPQGPVEQLDMSAVAMHVNLDTRVQRQNSRRARQPSPPEKELPMLPPPVPPKDGHSLVTVPSKDMYNSAQVHVQHNPPEDFVPWDRLIATIPEDDHLPCHEPLGPYNVFADGFGPGSPGLSRR